MNTVAVIAYEVSVGPRHEVRLLQRTSHHMNNDDIVRPLVYAEALTQLQTQYDELRAAHLAYIAAHEAATRMRKDAEFAISQEGRRLELELRREAAELAIDTARKLLSNKMTEADQKKLAETFVREMARG